MIAVFMMDGGIRTTIWDIKMNKVFLIFSMLLASSSFANTDSEMRAELNKLGLPLPNSGVQIIPLSKLNIPKEEKAEILRKQHEQHAQGYSYAKSSLPKSLLSLQSDAVQQKITYVDDQNDPASSEMRHSISNIKLAFPYSGISGLSSTEIIGFAPSGTFQSSGWTGVVEYFKAKNIGVCNYTKDNAQLTNGAVQVAKEVANNNVNGKTNTFFVEGSNLSGFTYVVSWFDVTYHHNLECASHSYLKETSNAVLELAKKIDASS